MAWPVTGSDSWLTHHKVEVTGSLMLTAPHFSPQPSQAEFPQGSSGLISGFCSLPPHSPTPYPCVGSVGCSHPAFLPFSLS